MVVGLYGARAAERERRAAAHDGAVEVRLQERQVDRAHPLRRTSAAHHVEYRAPEEYGFYANVNPEVPHPRWSQATERRIGGGFFEQRRPTLMFNGYTEVASLYKGLDLRVNY